MNDAHLAREIILDGIASGRPSALDADTINEFLEAGEEGQKSNARKPPPTFIEYLAAKDPVRLYALRRHVKWVKREGKKWGVDPERIAWWEI